MRDVMFDLMTGAAIKEGLEADRCARQALKVQAGWQEAAQRLMDRAQEHLDQMVAVEQALKSAGRLYQD